MKHASQTLGSGNIKLAVQLPEGEDLNEWIAVNSEFIESLLFVMLQCSVVGIVLGHEMLQSKCVIIHSQLVL